MTLGIDNLSEEQHRTVRLWAAVMVRGIRDAANDIEKGLGWLLDDARHVGSFWWICEEALHVDAEAMLRQVIKNMGRLNKK